MISPQNKYMAKLIPEFMSLMSSKPICLFQWTNLALSLQNSRSGNIRNWKPTAPLSAEGIVYEVTDLFYIMVAGSINRNNLVSCYTESIIYILKHHRTRTIEKS